MIQVPSDTRKGVFYTISDEGHCDCPGYRYHNKCKHVDRAQALGLLDKREVITIALLPEPATVLCLICGKPLNRITEVPNKKHATCLLREMRLKQQLRLITKAIDEGVVQF